MTGNLEFIGGHLELPASGLVDQHHNQYHRLTGPQIIEIAVVMSFLSCLPFVVRARVQLFMKEFWNADSIIPNIVGCSFEWMNKCRDSLLTSVLWYYLWCCGRCLCAIELRNVRSLGLELGLKPQTSGLGLGLRLETCWTRTRVLAYKTRTRLETCRTRTWQNVDSLHLWIQGGTEPVPAGIPTPFEPRWRPEASISPAEGQIDDIYFPYPSFSSVNRNCLLDSLSLLMKSTKFYIFMYYQW